jgi:hypothetical protein
LRKTLVKWTEKCRPNENNAARQMLATHTELIGSLQTDINYETGSEVGNFSFA